MTTLYDDLSRLADRGPHAMPDAVVGSALATAARNATTVRHHGPPLVGGRPRTGGTQADNEIERRPGRAAVVPLRGLGVRSDPRPRWVRGAAAAAIVTVAGGAVVLASQSDGSAPTTSDQRGPVATEPPAPAVSAADVELTAIFLSLLDLGTPEEMISFFDFNRPEAEVASCMVTAGFDYAPGPSPTEQVTADPLFTMAPEQYAAEYGFGIARPRRPETSAAEYANQAYVSSLSSDARERYNAAIGSCRSTPDRWSRSNALTVALEPIRRKIDADPIVVGALDAWRSCAAAAGYTFESPLAMRQSFYDRLNSGRAGDGSEQVHADEVAAATATLSCNAVYDSAHRQAAIAHFGEFRDLYDTALRLGLAPEAQG